MSAVLYEERGHVAVVTLARPEARNAVNGEVAQGIEDAVDRIEANPDVWVGVLTGAPPVFCAGADLKALDRDGLTGLSTPRGGFAGFVMRERTKPWIAAVEGPALAGGCELAVACDLIVATRSSSFGIPEVKRSLAAVGGGLFRLGRRLPFNVAMELALTGDPIDAEAAHAHGLVNVLCEDGQALTKALALAERIAANAPVAVRASRRIVLEGTHTADEVGWRLSGEALAELAATNDFKEGLTAFIEKRPPAWTGT
jgi:enoyl-CoA hydratase